MALTDHIVQANVDKLQQGANINNDKELFELLLKHWLTKIVEPMQGDSDLGKYVRGTFSYRSTSKNDIFRPILGMYALNKDVKQQNFPFTGKVIDLQNADNLTNAIADAKAFSAAANSPEAGLYLSRLMLNALSDGLHAASAILRWSSKPKGYINRLVYGNESKSKDIISAMVKVGEELRNHMRVLLDLKNYIYSAEEAYELYQPVRSWRNADYEWAATRKLLTGNNEKVIVSLGNIRQTLNSEMNAYNLLVKQLAGGDKSLLHDFNEQAKRFNAELSDKYRAKWDTLQSFVEDVAAKVASNGEYLGTINKEVNSVKVEGEDGFKRWLKSQKVIWHGYLNNLTQQSASFKSKIAILKMELSQETAEQEATSAALIGALNCFLFLVPALSSNTGLVAAEMGNVVAFSNALKGFVMADVKYMDDIVNALETAMATIVEVELKAMESRCTFIEKAIEVYS